MKYRIVMWAGVGFFVAGFWALCLLPTTSSPITSAEPMWTIVRLTCPIAFASHFPIGVYWVLLANAATYALVGMIIEALRQQLNRAR
jgi:hypothetical protein